MTARRRSASTRSAFSSKRRPKRYVEFRPSETEDIRYLWAAYRKGALDDLHPVFEEDLSQQDFEAAIHKVVSDNGWFAWTFIAEAGERGFLPIGVAFAWSRGRVIEMAHVVWFPWASPRNIWESSLNFYETMRKAVTDQMKEIDDPTRYFIVLEYARFEERRFFEKMCDRKVMRKVGHISGLYPDQTCVMFQTLSPVR